MGSTEPRRRALVLCTSDVGRDPRPYRMIRCLEKDFDVTVCAKALGPFAGKPFVALPVAKSSRLRKAKFVANSLSRRFESMIWADGLDGLKTAFSGDRGNFDLIVSHNLTLLPLAASIRGRAKILFDAREYYTRHFEDRPVWNLIFRPLNEYLCRRYLPMVDRMITVSDGLADEYKREFKISSEVVTSMPLFVDQTPSPVVPGKVRLVHHGNATPTRGLEVMIDLLAHLDERFTLDMILVRDGGKSYFEELQARAKGNPRVRFLDPVPMPEIPKFINQYDLGLYLSKPLNFNTAHMLPNKLFEFIQGRLGVAIGPAVEMRKVVERYGCGVVSDEFTPESMAAKLKTLTDADLTKVKGAAHAAARELCAESNFTKIGEIVRGMGV